MSFIYNDQHGKHKLNKYIFEWW